MNKKKLFIIVLCVLVLLGGTLTYIFLTREDENTSLNMIEKKWIDNNKKKLLDISIFSDVPILNYHGTGVIFDFLGSLEKDTGLEFNKVSYNLGSEIKTDLSFGIKEQVGDKDLLVYQDNYILVTKDGSIYSSPLDIKNINVGVLNSDLDKVNLYLFGSSVTFRTFENSTALFEAFASDKTLQAIAIPKLQYLENVISNNYTISYNIYEYKVNYVLSLSTNNDYSTLNNILTKYFKKWSNESLNDDINKYLVSNYFTFKGEESQNNAKFHSKRYVYGFVENKPYDAISDGELVGINSSIIAEFTKMSDVVIEYKKYKNYEELVNAFNANEIDFYLESNESGEFKLDVYRTISPFNNKIVILTKAGKNIIVNSANSLLNVEVGAVKNSKIASYLKQHNINVKEFNSVEELVNTRKCDVIAIDNNNYQYYIRKGLSKYDYSFETELDSKYSFVFRDISDNEQIENIFSFFLVFNPINTNIHDGIRNSLNINLVTYLVRNGFILIVGVVVLGLLVLVARKIKTVRKKNPNNLSKGDKLKYIDRLTSLKNRNYLNDNIERWDDSEVYPQTIIICDLNDIAYINDNYGHAEGDLVIKEAANILIQNQLANSEIIRTNGNEFLIYLVSYDEKQVISYIKKLTKEFKELPHNFGAAIGYSIISDAIKTIDDAVNEATIDMRSNKEEASKE